MGKVTNMADAKQRYMFVNMTRQKSKKEIEKIEKKKGKKTSKKERKRIIKIAAFYTTGIIMLTAVGNFVGKKLPNLLNSGNEISIDADKYKDGINITNVTSDRQIFLNGLHVDFNEMSMNEEIEKNVMIEISCLQNSDEVLNYIKQIYLDEYKQQFGGNATIDNIRLYKERNVALYKDVAQNGDEIIRKGISDTNDKVDSEIGLLSVSVQDGNKTYMEEAIYDGKSYENVYGQNETVEQDTESILQNIGAIVEHGIDYYSGFMDEKDSNVYKKRLINAVIDYKHSKIEKIIEPSNENSDKTLEDDNGIEH